MKASKFVLANMSVLCSFIQIYSIPYFKWYLDWSITCQRMLLQFFQYVFKVFCLKFFWVKYLKTTKDSLLIFIIIRESDAHVEGIDNYFCPEYSIQRVGVFDSCTFLPSTKLYCFAYSLHFMLGTYLILLLFLELVLGSAFSGDSSTVLKLSSMKETSSPSLSEDSKSIPSSQASYITSSSLLQSKESSYASPRTLSSSVTFSWMLPWAFDSLNRNWRQCGHVSPLMWLKY